MKKVLTSDEINYVMAGAKEKKAECFYEIWTKKESYL
jgi:phosphopantetheinyl transferase